MSPWEPDSTITRFNQSQPDTWHDLPAEFLRVLDYALQIAADTHGACDVTVGALVNLWGFGPATRYSDPHFQTPNIAALNEARAASGWQTLELDRTNRRVKQPGGLQLDCSAIAKGFAVDRLAHCLETRGIENYLVEIGGELRGAGVKPDGLPWWVALENPTDMTKAAPKSEFLIALNGLSVATSGDYRRSFEREGRRFCHSIDPRTGLPIRNDVASVTVIHPDCMTADAVSTALTVMGAQEGLAYAAERGIAARFLIRHGDGFTEHLTPSFAAMLQ